MEIMLSFSGDTPGEASGYDENQSHQRKRVA
jgi:hypothetical protein